jgi:hypothetical protein
MPNKFINSCGGMGLRWVSFEYTAHCKFNHHGKSKWKAQSYKWHAW